MLVIIDYHVRIAGAKVQLIIKREEKKREKIKMKRRNITSGGIEAALHRGRYFRGGCKEQRQLRMGR